MSNSECRLLELSDVEQAAEVISQAFMDDPLCAFMLPNKRTRVNTLKKFFRTYGEVNIRNHRAYGVGEPLKGVAFWMEPGMPVASITLISLSSFLPLMFTSYPIGLIKARKILEQTDIMHQKYVADPHFYLDNIGVLPAEWGKGYSSLLIRPFLEKADAKKAIVYTDTVTRSNIGLYKHFGFECMEECAIDGTGITVWALRRPIQ
jgi:ribosomal protein S18 acetylase RimI-like enzyme